ncbi:MAG: type IV toxin-antitoxin system AbiEi family antitoxin, partial [Phycisphaerales bacterium]|nr:type IV toxin-antitoxin system AbiEi family antitoxin [Phycisphaerales bacterium]
LHDEGYVVDATGGGVRVGEALGLIRAWGEAYQRGRFRRRSFFTLMGSDQLESAILRANADSGETAVFAAFSAAERQAPHVRQSKTWLYVADEFIDTFAEHTQAREVDSGENLVVLTPADWGVFVSFEPRSAISDRCVGCTDPAQTHVDLLRCGGRGEEAAQAVLEQCILPAWDAVRVS